ncbi:MAG: recombinase family protein, partial [Blastocatellia bacterium]
MKIALYARVSTLNKGQDADLQLRELRAYCQQRDWNVTAEYVDRGVPGSKLSRPQLNRLMEHATQHRFDAVLVWKLDRFGRSVRHLGNALAELEGQGISFVSQRHSPI